MLWVVEPYIPANGPIIYAPGQIAPGSYPVCHRGSFVASLTSLNRDSGNIQVADLVFRSHRNNQWSSKWHKSYVLGVQRKCTFKGIHNYLFCRLEVVV